MGVGSGGRGAGEWVHGARWQPWRRRHCCMPPSSARMGCGPCLHAVLLLSASNAQSSIALHNSHPPYTGPAAGRACGWSAPHPQQCPSAGEAGSGRQQAWAGRQASGCGGDRARRPRTAGKLRERHGAALPGLVPRIGTPAPASPSPHLVRQLLVQLGAQRGARHAPQHLPAATGVEGGGVARHERGGGAWPAGCGAPIRPAPTSATTSTHKPAPQGASTHLSSGLTASLKPSRKASRSFLASSYPCIGVSKISGGDQRRAYGAVRRGSHAQHPPAPTGVRQRPPALSTHVPLR